MEIDLFLALCVIGSSGFFVVLGMGWARLEGRAAICDIDTRRTVDTPRSGADTQHEGAIDADSSVDVTVIIAAHNEARHMPALCNALARQTWPRHRFHVLLVDDRSDDGTASAARAAAPADLSLRILRIDAVPAGVSPKKYALHTAIEHSATENLLFTDADCEPAPHWIESMMRYFSAGADVVIGLSPARGGGVAAQYAAFESVRTALLSCGAAGWNRPYMATGRNWGYRASVYRNIGGLTPLFSQLGGDDDLLFQRFTSAGARVRVNTDPGGICPTAPPESLPALLRAKLRHFRTSASYTRSSQLWLGLFVASELLALGAAPVWLAAVRGVHPLLLVTGVVAKLLYDTSFLLPAARTMGFSPGLTFRLRFVFLEWIHALFSPFVGLLSFVVRSRW